MRKKKIITVLVLLKKKIWTFLWLTLYSTQFSPSKNHWVVPEPPTPTPTLLSTLCVPPKTRGKRGSKEESKGVRWGKAWANRFFFVKCFKNRLKNKLHVPSSFFLALANKFSAAALVQLAGPVSTSWLIDSWGDKVDPWRLRDLHPQPSGPRARGQNCDPEGCFPEKEVCKYSWNHFYELEGTSKFDCYWRISLQPI